MKRTTLLLVLLTAMFMLSASMGIHAQLIPAPLSARIENAALVIEGKVVGSRSYFGERGRIHTSHVVKVEKAMKGIPHADTLEVVLLGGTVGNTTDWISHHLYLAPGEMGVFFLIPRRLKNMLVFNGTPAYDVYADLQGFIRYKVQPGATVGSEPFHVYRDIERDLYPLLGWQDGNAPVLHRPVPLRTMGGPMIDSLRPLVITAGTRSVLSIHGAGFQAAKGSIYFRNAQDGGATWMTGDSADIQLWTDSLLQIRIPSVTGLPDIFDGTAGTGSVVVLTSAGDSVQSAETLHVQFAIDNRRSSLDGISNHGFLANQDSISSTDTTGGYTYRLNSSFALTDSAAIAFKKAVRTWRCATGVNFKIGTDTVLSVATNDTVCLVKWDDPADSLSAYTLGQTIVRLRACIDSTELIYFPVEFDLIFARNKPWNFDTLIVDSSKWDFLTVATHELGHTLLLYHVIDPAELMHFEIFQGTIKRNVTPNALIGANWVMGTSTVSHGFCPSPMVAINPVDCNTLGAHEEPGIEIEAVVFPNPSCGTFTLNLTGIRSTEVTGIEVFDAQGNPLGANSLACKSDGEHEWYIDMKHGTQGLYFIRLRTRYAMLVKRIILIP